MLTRTVSPPLETPKASLFYRCRGVLDTIPNQAEPAMNAGGAVMPQQRRPNHNNLNDHLERSLRLTDYSGTTLSRPTISSPRFRSQDFRSQDFVAKIS
ncbi:MAG: hypothetical protein WBA66_10230 [Xanthobacteraceae bacterium]